MKKEHRLLKREEFVLVSQKGRAFKGDKVIVRYLGNNADIARVGITVTKKNGNAVKRNRIKRQIRSIVDDHITGLRGIDVVVVARRDYDCESFMDTKHELGTLLSKIGEQRFEKIES